MLEKLDLLVEKYSPNKTFLIGVCIDMPVVFFLMSSNDILNKVLILSFFTKRSKLYRTSYAFSGLSHTFRASKFVLACVYVNLDTCNHLCGGALKLLVLNLT